MNKKIKVKGLAAMSTEFQALCPKREGTRPLTHVQSFHEEPCYVADYQLLAQGKMTNLPHHTYCGHA